jgi:hypothetical protein
VNNTLSLISDPLVELALELVQRRLDIQVIAKDVRLRKAHRLKKPGKYRE